MSKGLKFQHIYQKAFLARWNAFEEGSNISVFSTPSNFERVQSLISRHPFKKGSLADLKTFNKFTCKKSGACQLVDNPFLHRAAYISPGNFGGQYFINGIDVHVLSDYKATLDDWQGFQENMFYHNDSLKTTFEQEGKINLGRLFEEIAIRCLMPYHHGFMINEFHIQSFLNQLGFKNISKFKSLRYSLEYAKDWYCRILSVIYPNNLEILKEFINLEISLLEKDRKSLNNFCLQAYIHDLVENKAVDYGKMAIMFKTAIYIKGSVLNPFVFNSDVLLFFETGILYVVSPQEAIYLSYCKLSDSRGKYILDDVKSSILSKDVLNHPSMEGLVYLREPCDVINLVETEFDIPFITQLNKKILNYPGLFYVVNVEPLNVGIQPIFS